MVWPLIAEALYPPQHPYSWMTIGVMEDLDRATMEDVSSFFRRFYVPSNASLAIVGDLDEERAFALAERYFEPIPGGTKAPWPVGPRGRRSRRRPSIVLHDRVELDRLYLVWPTVPHFHDDDAALLLLGDVLARGRSSRLYRKLVIEEEIAQDVTAYQSGRELAGSFGIIVTLRPSRSIEPGAKPGRVRAQRHRGLGRGGRRAAPRPESQGCRLLFRARAHGRVRRGRRSSQRLQRLPRRSVADHDRCRSGFKPFPPIDLQSVAQRYLDRTSASRIIGRRPNKSRVLGPARPERRPCQ